MSKVKYLMLPVILLLFVIGYFYPASTDIIFNYTQISWWVIFLINFVLIGLLSLVPLLGIYFVGSIAYNLGSQLPIVAAKYSCVPLYKIIMVLSIHGIFEIISMAIALNMAIEMITRPKLKRIIYQILIIGVLLLIGSILEQNISYNIFKVWRTQFQ